MAVILFENKACLALNKLAGEDSEALAIGFCHPARLYPVHRLDTPVTGCLLLAKTREAAAFLSAAFRRGGPVHFQPGPGAAEKRYWAVVEMPGKPVPQSAELRHLIITNAAANKSFAFPPGREFSGDIARRAPPKEAVLRYRVAGRGERYLFLEIELVTGRHHQIRAQFAMEKIHIKGDLKYGAKRGNRGGGIMLHARSLSFPSPLGENERIFVEAEPPAGHTLWDAFKEAALSCQKNS